MCRSSADGGRRCVESAATTAKRNLRKRLGRAKGDEAAQLQAQIDNIDEATSKYGNFVSPLQLPIPEKVQHLLDAFDNTDGTPLLVGGTVRDALLAQGEVPKDFDIEIHGMSIDEVATTLREKGYRADLVGQQFGVIKTYAGNEEIDLSVPRSDSLTGVGHQGFTVEMDPQMGVVQASERRDFTLNAMMYDPKLGVCIDPHGGRNDLEQGRLRHVSDAFAEDPLRPLRGFQFASRYGFTIAPETLEMCQSLRQEFDSISQERVVVEWEKFYGKSHHPSKGLQSLTDMGWADTVPEFDSIDLAAADRVMESKSKERPVLLAAVLTSNMSDEGSKAFVESTVDGKKQQQRIHALSRSTPPSLMDRASVRQWARTLGQKGLSIQDWYHKEEAINPQSSRLQQVKTAADKEGLFNTAPISSLTGKDVFALYPDKKGGPWMGELLRKAEAAEDAGEFTDKDGALQWLRRELD